jgi:(p)ppGpp synthase/HD superfamily hydrolase
MAVADPVTQNPSGPEVSIERLIAAIRDHHPSADLGIVEHAVEVATVAHAGQTRLSGEPYVAHSIAVATDRRAARTRRH